VQVRTRTPPAPSPGPGSVPSSGAPPTASVSAALPVALSVGDRAGEAVRRWVEGVLGWQPVGSDEDDRAVPPALRLVDVEAADRVREASSRIPTVLLVGEDDDPVRAAAAATGVAADLVLQWPGDRDRLADEVARLRAAARPETDGARIVRVGGAAGGVGTSTVTLALAGLSGWVGRRTLVVVGASAPVGDALDVPAAAVVAADLWRRAPSLAGVPDLRVVRVVDRDAVPDPSGRGLDAAVVDVGVAHEVDVLVCRPDAAGLDAAAGTTAAAVVVVGEGPATSTAVDRACGHRRRVVLPASARVARAGLHRRVPASLPGSWLRGLRPLIPGGPSLEASTDGPRRPG
jgi:hypothetical protein